MSVLTKELKRWGFLSGIENTLYYLDTGTYTTLFIERCEESKDSFFCYDFYKQTFYCHYSNQIVLYGIHLSANQLLQRVQQYMDNRNRYLQEQGG